MGLLGREVFSHERAYKSNETAIDAEYLAELPPIERWRLPHAAWLLGLCLKVNELLPSESHNLENEETEYQISKAQSEVEARQINKTCHSIGRVQNIVDVDQCFEISAVLFVIL